MNEMKLLVRRYLIVECGTKKEEINDQVLDETIAAGTESFGTEAKLLNHLRFWHFGYMCDKEIEKMEGV